MKMSRHRGVSVVRLWRNYAKMEKNIKKKKNGVLAKFVSEAR